MDNDTLIPPTLRKKLPMKVIIVAWLAIHGIFLIIIGLIAFFGGFVGFYQATHGSTTLATMIAVLGASLAWILLLEGIVSFFCAQGLWTQQRWAFWLTIALEAANLILAGFILRLQLFTIWPIALSMGFSGGILLYMLIAVDPRMLSAR